MKIKLWGVRGSMPTPLTGEDIEQKIRKTLNLAKPGDLSSEETVDEFLQTLPFSLKSTYGGNTTCIELTTDDGRTIIVDCGSGMVNLGKKLMNESFLDGTGYADILMTHTHWDHIQGIPFFAPFYVKGNHFTFFSPIDDLHDRIMYQQVSTHFPIIFDAMQSTKEFAFITTDETYLLQDDIKIFSKQMPHPGKSYGYRIEHNGKVFVYTSDCEFNITEIDQIGDYENFFNNADVLIFDAQYTFAEAMHKMDWGHSSAFIAVDIATRFNAKHLVLFHHDPAYGDSKLDDILTNTLNYQSVHDSKMEALKIDIAHEGLEIDI